MDFVEGCEHLDEVNSLKISQLAFILLRLMPFSDARLWPGTVYIVLGMEMRTATAYLWVPKWNLEIEGERGGTGND